MAVKTIGFMLPWVDTLSANSNFYGAGFIARVETSIADRAITDGKALELNANIFDQQLNTTDSPTFAGLTVDTNTLFVDAANSRVGIGTTAPQGSLSVVGEGRIVTIGDSGTANTPVLKSRNSADTGWTFMRYSAYRHEFHRDGDVLAMQIENSGDVKFFNDNGLSIGMIWDASTNRLGIRTTTPADVIEARGAIRASDSTSQYIQFNPTPATSGYTFVTSLTDSGIEQVCSSTGRPFIWKLGESEVLRLTSTAGDSRLGIGTTSPGATLDARRNTDGYVFRAYTTTGNLSYAQFGSVSYMWHAGTTLRFGTSSNHGFEFGTNNSVRMTIDSSGNVGIGTTSPARPLHINGADPRIRLTDTDGGGSVELRNNVGAAALLTNAAHNIQLAPNGAIGLTIKYDATHTTLVNIANLPTSASGLSSGDVWNDSGTLKVA